MTIDYKFPVIDGHVDTVYKIPKDKRIFSELSEVGHYDLPRMEQGNVQAALFAIYPTYSMNYILKSLDNWFRLVVQPANGLMQIKNLSDFKKVLDIGKKGVILHFEGAGGIDKNFRFLRIAYQLGLRTLGLSWANVNKFATGAMFKDPQKKTGLTNKGRELVSEAQSLGITIDVSHLNEPSFWDVYEVAQKPIFASHSNARSIVDHPRNLTDDQIKAIHEIHGTIGINFGMEFLNAKQPGKDDFEMGFGPIKKQIDYIVEIADIHTVAIGSDFDGTKTPNCLKDCSKYPDLWNFLLENGYNKQDIEKISHENLMRLFKDTWKNNSF
ncbi:MAG: dipeptidase [Promethearchaeota archaeon]